MNKTITCLQEFLKAHWHYLLVAFFGIVLSVGVWGNIHNYIDGDDYAFHVERIIGTATAIKDGQLLLPQVSPDSMYGFGYGYNIFYGPLLTWASLPLRFLFGSWPLAINSLCILAMVSSGLLMCYAISRISKQKSLAFLAGVFYMAAPYHLLNLYDRFALGEFVGMAILPLLLLGLYELVQHQRSATWKIAISAFLLLLLHNLTVVLAALMSVIYLLVNLKQILNWQSLKQILLAAGFALGASACFLLPMVEAKTKGNYGVFDSAYSSLRLETNAEKISEQHLSLSALVYSDYDNALLVRDKMALGLIAAIGLIGYVFIRKGIKSIHERKFTDSLYVISLLALFMTTSLVPWHWLPSFLYSVQFPWRFLGIFVFTNSIISGYTIYHCLRRLEESKQQILAIIAALVAVSTVAPLFTLQNVAHTSPEAAAFDLGLGSAGWSGEYAAVGLLCAKNDHTQCGLKELSDNLAERGNSPIVTGGKANLTKYQKQGTKINLHFSQAQNGTKIELPLIWYPGYRATVNNQRISVQPSETYGLVELSLPDDIPEGEIRAFYGVSLATGLGVAISAGTILATGVIIIVNHRKKQKEPLNYE